MASSSYIGRAVVIWSVHAAWTNTPAASRLAAADPEVIGQGEEAICPPGYEMCSDCCDQDEDCLCDDTCEGDGSLEGQPCSRPHKAVQQICPAGFATCPLCCDRNPDCKCSGTCETHADDPASFRCTLPHRAVEEVCPVGFMPCPKCCDRNENCECDDFCGMGPTGSTTADFKCTVPHRKDVAVCPAGYYICPDCCDTTAECKCQHSCIFGAESSNDSMCILPRIVEEKKCPAGFYICPECCDRNFDCKCDRHCGLGPTGHNTKTFKCTVPHRSEAVCPPNFTMCPNCCDRNLDCACDHTCGLGPTGETTDDFKCSMPHTSREEQRMENGPSLLGFAMSLGMIFAMGGTCAYNVIKRMKPRGDRLLEEEMPEMESAPSMGVMHGVGSHSHDAATLAAETAAMFSGTAHSMGGARQARELAGAAAGSAAFRSF